MIGNLNQEQNKNAAKTKSQRNFILGINWCKMPLWDGGQANHHGSQKRGRVAGIPRRKGPDSPSFTKLSNCSGTVPNLAAKDKQKQSRV